MISHLHLKIYFDKWNVKYKLLYSKKCLRNLDVFLFKQIQNIEYQTFAALDK